MIRAKKFIVVDMKYKRGGSKMLVLEAIPYDRWVRAGEIASKIGLTPKSVGILISWHLTPSHVEKKEVEGSTPRIYVYKRCQHITHAQRISELDSYARNL